MRGLGVVLIALGILICAFFLGAPPGRSTVLQEIAGILLGGFIALSGWILFGFGTLARRIDRLHQVTDQRLGEISHNVAAIGHAAKALLDRR